MWSSNVQIRIFNGVCKCAMTQLFAKMKKSNWWKYISIERQLMILILKLGHKLEGSFWFHQIQKFNQ